MAAFCACCGAEITPKSGPCTKCGAPYHGSVPTKPLQGKTYPGIGASELKSHDRTRRVA